MATGIVLSGGILATGELDERTIARVDKGIDLLAQGHVDRLIMAGGYGAIITFRENGFYDIIRLSDSTSGVPTQGAAMVAYARSRGIDANVLLQDVSRDTVGELFFTRKQHLEPNRWRDTVLICNVSQAPRALLLAGRIFGPQYASIAHATVHPSDLQSEVLAKEATSFEVFLKQFGDVPPGDLVAFEQRLYECHALYSKIPLAERPRF